MFKNFFLFTFSFITITAFSQTSKNHNVFISSGTSFAGTGDLRGFYFTIGGEKKIKRWNFNINATTTIHDGQDDLYYQVNNSGPVNDGSIRFSTAGLQLAGIGGFSFTKSSKHNLQFGLGPVFRYQSSSYHDQYAIYYPAATQLPVPVVVFTNRFPLRTFAIGGIAKLGYDYTIKNKWVVGINTTFQTDSNGDNFFNKGLQFGYKF